MRRRKSRQYLSSMLRIVIITVLVFLCISDPVTRAFTADQRYLSLFEGENSHTQDAWSQESDFLENTGQIRLDESESGDFLPEVEYPEERPEEAQSGELSAETGSGELSSEPQIEQGEIALEDQPADSDAFTEDQISDSNDFLTPEEEILHLGDGFIQSADTGLHQVIVSYGPEAAIPEDAFFRAVEVDHESDTFQLCEMQSGKQFDWILDVGFYRTEISEDGEEELIEIEPQAEVQVTIQMNDMLDGDHTEITHFAEDGIEELGEEEIDMIMEENGDGEISFSLDSFSLIAGQTYHTATVTAGMAEGRKYLVYTVIGDTAYFLYHWGGNGIVEIPVDVLKGNGSSITEAGDSLYWQDSNVIVNQYLNDADGFYWTYAQQNGTFGLKNKYGSWLTVGAGNRSIYNYQTGTVNVSNDFHSLYIGPDSSTRKVIAERTGNYYWELSFNQSKYTWESEYKSSYFTSPGTNPQLYIAEVGTDYTMEKEGQRTLPGAVYTGKLQQDRLYFFNVEENNQKVRGVAGITYGIFGADPNNPVATFTTTSDMKVTSIESLGLSPGTYVMKQIAVPDEYILFPTCWEFTINSNQTILELHEIVQTAQGNIYTGESTGVIFNYKKSDIEYEKTAEVVDYANRTYKVDMTVLTNYKRYRLQDLNVVFAVDQSNSMLFPADMAKVPDVKLEFDVINSNYYAKTTQLNQYLREGKLKEGVLYYFIPDPSTSSTVVALWYDGQEWMYQDSSYYAKAYWNPNGDLNNDKIVTQNHMMFPKRGTGWVSTDVHGGSLGTASGTRIALNSGYKLENGATSTDIYVSTESMNRLYYLERSMVDLLQALGSFDSKTTATIVTFTKKLKNNGCLTQSLNPSGINSLMKMIGEITTDGGTRQDYALHHVYEGKNNATSDETVCGSSGHLVAGKNNYVILITDGAPVADGGQTLGSYSTRNDTGTVYGKITYEANRIKNYPSTVGGQYRQNTTSTLITVGLGMTNVLGGREELKYISSGGGSTASDQNVTTTNWYQPEYSSTISTLLINDVLNGLTVEIDTNKVVTAQVKDIISESFYPYYPGKEYLLFDPARNYYIYRDGREARDESVSDGRIYFDTSINRWCVEWKPEVVSIDRWHGSVYLKAKEDFIGGNAISTNDEATVTLRKLGLTDNNNIVSVDLLQDRQFSIYYDRPNVNVRLLDLDQYCSEVTVFLGDPVSGYLTGQSEDSPILEGLSPEKALKELYKHIQFTEIVNNNVPGDNQRSSTVGAGTSYSGIDPSIQTGWETASQIHIPLSELKNAEGENAGIYLSDEEWDALVRAANESIIPPASYIEMENGTPSIRKPYAYASVNGDIDYVGYFEYCLKKKAAIPESANLYDHQSQIAGTAVETYTLELTYHPYKLGSRERMNDVTLDGFNHFNVNYEGTDSPGMEVNGTGNPMLLKSDNTHTIHVIDGSLDLTKALTLHTPLDSHEEEIFLFRIERMDNDRNGPAALYDFEKNEDGTRNSVNAKDDFTVQIDISDMNLIEGTAYEYQNTYPATKLSHLPRGTYRITELPVTGYEVESMADNGSNCKSEVAVDGKSFIFVLGTYVDTGNNSTKDAITPENLTYVKDSQGHTSSVLDRNTASGIQARAIVTNRIAVMRANLLLLKKSSIDPNTALEGAGFQLYEALDVLDPESGTYTHIITDHIVPVYTSLNAEGKTEGSPSEAVITDADGKAYLYELEYEEEKPAIYYMKEIVSPKGYQLYDGVIRIEIAYSEETKKEEVTFRYGKTIETDGQEIWIDIENWRARSPEYDVSIRMEAGADGNPKTNDVTIKNVPLYNLPSAGSSGIFPYVLIGTLLMMTAARMRIKAK